MNKIIDNNTQMPEPSISQSLLKQATAKALAAPDIDTKKVETIRKTITNGKFKINADTLAQKMIELEEAIFGTNTV